MENKMQYSDLINRLKRLDEDVSLLYDDDRRINCVIVGGSALILLHCITRATHDIDVISCPKEINHLLNKYDFNQQVQTYINNFPCNFEDRFVKIDVDTKIMNYYTASLEDIVIAKLCSFRDTDHHDITQPSVVDKIDWNLLEVLSVELKDSTLNDRNYTEFKANYDKYIGRHKKCEN